MQEDYKYAVLEAFKVQYPIYASKEEICIILKEYCCMKEWIYKEIDDFEKEGIIIQKDGRYRLTKEPKPIIRRPRMRVSSSMTKKQKKDVINE